MTSPFDSSGNAAPAGRTDRSGWGSRLQAFGRAVTSPFRALGRAVAGPQDEGRKQRKKREKEARQAYYQAKNVAMAAGHEGIADLGSQREDSDLVAAKRQAREEYQKIKAENQEAQKQNRKAQKQQGREEQQPGSSGSGSSGIAARRAQQEAASRASRKNEQGWQQLRGDDLGR